MLHAYGVVLMALTGSCLVGQAAVDVGQLRREVRHGELLKLLAARLEATDQAKVKTLVARDLARVRLEAGLLQRVAPLTSLVGRKPKYLLEKLVAIEKTAAEELVLAELAFHWGSKASGEAALGRARDLDPGTKKQTDVLLARVRRQAVPRGGYYRYRGAWLALAERDRARAIDDALHAVDAVQLDGLAPPFPLQVERSNRTLFDGLGKGVGESVLRQSAQQIRKGLENEYAEVRSWLSSYSRSPKRRTELIAKRDGMRKDQAAALALIRRYTKLEQGQVNAYRQKLASMYREYRTVLDRDMVELRRVSKAQAYDLHERLRRRESALVLIDRFLKVTRKKPLAVGSVRPAPGSTVTTVHLLPGRHLSGLEDSLWLLVKFRSGHLLDTLSRGSDILRHRKRLTKWEVVLLDEVFSDVIEQYNERVAVSLDFAELEFVEVTNAYRRTLGLRPFELEERLNVCAKKHSREMVDMGYFGHISPVARNRGPSDRARLEGYNGGVGENCLAGRVSGKAAFEGWYHSPGHHRNLISGGPHLGIGAVDNHGMWTMVAGGTDWTWRSLHKDLPPFERARLEALVRDLVKIAGKPGVKPDDALLGAARQAVAAEVPRILPILARVAFPITRTPQHTDHPAFPVCLSLLVSAEVGTTWRALQIAAVSAAIEALRLGRGLHLRMQAWEIVKPHLSADIPYGAALRGERLVEMVNAVYKHWEDVAQWRFRKRADALPPATARIAGRVGDGPSLNSPRAMLTRRDRLRMAKKFGGDSRTEKAVENGLKFLAKIQDTDGAWRARSFGMQLPGFVGNPGRGTAEWEVGMTGLCLLAFSSAGYTTVQGEYQDVVRKGTRFLLSRVVDYGKFETTSSHYMYNHALGTQALCELYSYSADPAIGATAQLAVDFLVYAQHRDTGGWRYGANDPGDTSVTGWVIMALNSAYKAEIQVSGFRPAQRFLDRVTASPYYQVGYTSPGDRGTTEMRLTAVAMTGRLFLGAPVNDSRLVLPAFRMMEHLPHARRVDFYYWYYATLALFQLGDPFWKQWNAALKPVVLDAQVSSGHLRGSWPPHGPWANYGGCIYQTALGILMLTTYYRYDRALKVRTHPFTGDIDKHARVYFEALRTEKDPRRLKVASRRMLDLFGSSLVSPIARLLKSGKDKPAMRHELARMLVDIVEQRHVPILVDLLSNPDATVVVHAIEAFAQVSSRSSAKVLIQHLGSRHRNVRAHCAAWLGRLGDADAIKGVSARLAVERDGWVKGELSKALAALGRRSELHKLLEKLLPADSEGYLATLQGLAPLEQHGLVGFVTQLETAQPVLYARLPKMLSTYKGASAISILLLLLQSENLQARTRAVVILRALTRRNFGFNPKARLNQRTTALQKWARWWKKAAPGFGSQN